MFILLFLSLIEVEIGSLYFGSRPPKNFSVIIIKSVYVSLLLLQNSSQTAAFACYTNLLTSITLSDAFLYIRNKSQKA